MNTDHESHPLSGEKSTTLLTCVVCGYRLESSAQWIWLRCPSCGTLGYPDRAGQNLLSVDWDCLSCGTRNSGLVNFCTSCGTGLASRCLRCEAPVYTAICSRCGSHQERLLRLQSMEVQRAAWTPILLTQLEESRQPLAEKIDSRPLTKAERRRLTRERRAETRCKLRQLFQQKRGLVRIPGWGLIWVTVGLLMLSWQFRAELEPQFTVLLQQVQTSIQLTQGIDAVAVWWADFVVTANNLSTDSPAYSYLFASAVFGLAAIPILLYLLHRILRRLFP